jgi:2,3-bisphosphoglycerate-dependent phosphoglycerate mutase
MMRGVAEALARGGARGALAAFAGCFAMVFVAGLSAAPEARAQEGLTVYLFRHAEKDTAGEDPALTAQGLERAMTLLGMIAEPDVNHLFSTDYRRTRQTIQPFTQAHGVPVKLYDPRTLDAFADSLKTLQGVALVSGHSNTTPELVRLLSGQNVPEIDEKEYDNLYIVTFTGGTPSFVNIKVPPFFSTPGG